jgi:hypothetical protein
MAQNGRRKDYGEFIHFRAPRDLLAALDRFAAQAAGPRPVNRSHAIRTILYQVLTDDPARANAVQVQYDFATEQRVLVAKIARKLSAAVPGIVEEILDEEQ